MKAAPTNVCDDLLRVLLYGLVEVDERHVIVFKYNIRCTLRIEFEVVAWILQERYRVLSIDPGLLCLSLALLDSHITAKYIPILAL